MNPLLCMPIAMEMVTSIVAPGVRWLRKNSSDTSPRLLRRHEGEAVQPPARGSPTLPFKNWGTARLLVAPSRKCFPFSVVNSRRRNAGLDSLCSGAADAHAVEGTVDEDKRDDEEGSGENVRQAAALG